MFLEAEWCGRLIIVEAMSAGAERQQAWEVG